MNQIPEYENEARQYLVERLLRHRLRDLCEGGQVSADYTSDSIVKYYAHNDNSYFIADFLIEEEGFGGFQDWEAFPMIDRDTLKHLIEIAIRLNWDVGQMVSEIEEEINEEEIEASNG